MTHTSLTNSTCCLKLAIWTSSWYYFLLKLPYCSSFHFSNTSLYDSTTIRSKHIITLILDITNSRLYVTFIPVIITLLHYPFCIIGIDWNSRTCIYGIIYGISLDPPEKLQSPWSMCSNWWHKHQSQSSATFLPTFSHTHPPATPIPGKRTVVMFQLTVANPLVDIFNWQINGQMKKKMIFATPVICYSSCWCEWCRGDRETCFSPPVVGWNAVYQRKPTDAVAWDRRLFDGRNVQIERLSEDKVWKIVSQQRHWCENVLSKTGLLFTTRLHLLAFSGCQMKGTCQFISHLILPGRCLFSCRVSRPVSSSS
jgi:hypothetical protein